MFYSGSSRQEDPNEIYAKAGRKMLEGGGGWGDCFQREFQKSLDRHSAAMERLAAALEQASADKQKEMGQ